MNQFNDAITQLGPRYEHTLSVLRTEAKAGTGYFIERVRQFLRTAEGEKAHIPKRIRLLHDVVSLLSGKPDEPLAPAPYDEVTKLLDTLEQLRQNPDAPQPLVKQAKDVANATVRWVWRDYDDFVNSDEGGRRTFDVYVDPSQYAEYEAWFCRALQILGTQLPDDWPSAHAELTQRIAFLTSHISGHADDTLGLGERFAYDAWMFVGRYLPAKWHDQPDPA